VTTPAVPRGDRRVDEVLTDGLAGGIARLRRAMRRSARIASPGNPLAVTQLELLSALTEHPGARPGQLARVLHMRPSTVTTIVNAL
jgi:DNA-binding MarR family transcriptional regulator